MVGVTLASIIAGAAAAYAADEPAIHVTPGPRSTMPEPQTAPSPAAVTIPPQTINYTGPPSDPPPFLHSDGTFTYSEQQTADADLGTIQYTLPAGVTLPATVKLTTPPSTATTSGNTASWTDAAGVKFVRTMPYGVPIGTVTISAGGAFATAGGQAIPPNGTIADAAGHKLAFQGPPNNSNWNVTVDGAKGPCNGQMILLDGGVAYVPYSQNNKSTWYKLIDAAAPYTCPAGSPP